jgi:DNA-binding transcriptional LysR family regulator
MADLADYTAFVAIVERGSLTAAAHHLDRSLQAVSRSLASLERELTVTLVQRTTRQCRPTEAGLAFLARIRPALAQIALARDTVGEHAQGIIGSIRIAAPALFGPASLMPVIAAYLADKPGISLDLVLDHGYADPVADGIDLAVRFGELPIRA